MTSNDALFPQYNVSVILSERKETLAAQTERQGHVVEALVTKDAEEELLARGILKM
jgi:hypothetical protein